MDRTLFVMGAFTLLVLVVGFVVLTLAGRSTVSYVLFVSGPLVSSVVGAALARKVGTVQQLAESVQHATTGVLPARLDQVQDQLATASAERTALVDAVAALPIAATTSPTAPGQT